MNWFDRINRSATVLPLGSGQAEILGWSYSPHLPDNVPHRHTYFEVCLVGGHGRARYTVEGVPHAVRPGDVFFARPGVVHQIQNTGKVPMELYWVSWSWNPHTAAGVRSAERAETRAEIDALLRAFSSSEVLVVPDSERRVGSLWTTLRTLGGMPPIAGSETQLAAVMSSLILAIAQAGVGDDVHLSTLSPSGSASISPEAASKGRDPSDRLGRMAVRYIHDNLDRRLPLDEIASHIHVSPRHLSRLMMHFTGVSPAAYIEQARIDRASALLRNTNIPIKEVANDVGYDDVHHFTRAFTRCCGCSPGRYRKEPELYTPHSRRDILM